MLTQREHQQLEHNNSVFATIAENINSWIANGNAYTVDEITKLTDDYNITSMRGRNLIMTAILMQSDQQENTCLLIEDLVKRGVDINAQDFQGNTSLMLAVSHNLDLIAMKLINFGADITISNHAGMVACAMAKGRMARYLEAEVSALSIVEEEQVTQPQQSDVSKIEISQLSDESLAQLGNLKQYIEDSGLCNSNDVTDILIAMDDIIENNGQVILSRIKEFYARRWEMVRDDNTLRYDVNDMEPLNESFFLFARILAKDVVEEKSKQKEFFYRLLFPSLTNIKDTFGSSISEFTLDQIIICGDSDQGFLDIKECLEYAICAENGRAALCRTFINGDEDYRERSTLSDNEINRLAMKSSLLSKVVEKWRITQQSLSQSNTMLDYLEYFRDSFYRAGEKKEGTHFVPSGGGYQLVIEFCAFWKSLQADSKEKLMSFEVARSSASDYKSLQEMYDVFCGFTTMPCIDRCSTFISKLIESNLDDLSLPAVVDDRFELKCLVDGVKDLLEKASEYDIFDTLLETLNSDMISLLSSSVTFFSQAVNAATPGSVTSPAI